MSIPFVPFLVSLPWSPALTPPARYERPDDHLLSFRSSDVVVLGVLDRFQDQKALKWLIRKLDTYKDMGESRLMNAGMRGPWSEFFRVVEQEVYPSCDTDTFDF